MAEFIQNYPIIKWVLIGLGVIAVLSKYLNLDLIDILFKRKEKGYQFEETNHLNDSQLKSLIDLLNSKEWITITKKIQQFSDSYRSFAFRTLGQYGKIEHIEEWISKEPSKTLPQLVKAYYLVHKAWEIRGRDTIDNVSDKNIRLFKETLQEAKELLLSIRNKADYGVNINALLLKIYRALNTERSIIHSTFKEAEQNHPNHAELNFNYYSAISKKWGGTEEEINQYHASLETKSDFIHNLIIAQYYFDYAHLYHGEDQTSQVNQFLLAMKNFLMPTDELYKYEFYLLLYWTSNNLEYKQLEEYYKPLTLPYWKD